MTDRSRSMNITLVGYGRMGKEVEAAAQERGHSIVSTVDPRGCTFAELSPAALRNSSGIIEFAQPEGILPRISLAAEYQIPYVIGTTGWDSGGQFSKEVKAIADNKNAAVLIGSNFSVGANLFFRIAEAAAAAINAFPDYDIAVSESHHRKKRDSPSGSALTIAEKIIRANGRKNRICAEPLQRKIAEDELHISSLRAGSIPGIHRVILDSPADSIVLEHSARGRSGFAAGAVLALEWLRKQERRNKRGFYTADDFFTAILE